MRALVYGIAILAAAGIAFAITMNPGDPDASTESATGSSVTQPEKPEAADVNLTKVTLSVPDMMCPHACYPSIKERLEKSDSIVLVELAPQKVEGVIDNRKIIVTHRDDFKVEDAVAQLETIGFGDVSLVP